MDTTELQNQAIEIRDAENEGENTALRVGTMLLNIIGALSSLATVDDANDAVSRELSVYFGEGGQLKAEALPDEFVRSLRAEVSSCTTKESSTELLNLIHSRIILCDSMDSSYDGFSYTPEAGDIVLHNGYVAKWNGSGYNMDGAPPLKKHVIYVNKHTGKFYMWNGSALEEVGNDYEDQIQISKMGQTDEANIPVGKLHYIPSQAKLVYRISSTQTWSWTPKRDRLYIDITDHTLYRWTGSSFQRVSVSGGRVAIVDDVVTDDPEQALSARQGKRLADIIAGLGLEAHQANGTLFISRVADNRSVPPVITVNETSTAVTVTATGNGTITLYRGGTSAGDVVSNPLTINKTSTASVVRFYATAQQSGKTVSEMASLAVTIAAYAAPNPRLTSPAGGSSVNLTRTATQTPTSLSAQSGSPVTIPSGVASQQVAVTVNPPSDTLAFNNLLSKTVTFPYSVTSTFSPWGTWKGSSGYTSGSIIIIMAKITVASGGGTFEVSSGRLYIDGVNTGKKSDTLKAGTHWYTWQIEGWAGNTTQYGFINATATIVSCYAVNFADVKIGDDDTIDAAVQRLTNADIQLTPNDPSYSNAGAQSLTITHNGTDTVVSNITTGNTITVEAGDTVSISSGSVSFSVDVTTHTAGTATVVVKGADLSQPISVAVSGTGFTCDTMSVTAADANSTNGKIVVVTYDASGSNTGALTLTSSEFNMVSVTLNGTNE